MSLSSRRLNRRQILRGAGTAIALPFLESLISRPAWAASPKRLLFYYVPCGIHMAGWTPSTVGADFEFTPILKPLEPLRSDVTVISGLANMPAKPDGAGDHASGTGAFLTCAHPKKTNGVDIQNGISADQVVAGKIGGETRFPSLQLGTDSGSAAGDCDSGYSCAYARNISWAGPASPLPKLTSPQTIFDRMYQSGELGASPAERERRRKHKLSVLDFALDEARRLQPRLGKTDRQKLEEYLGGVRDVEKRIANPPAPSALSMRPVCAQGTKPVAGLPFPMQVQVLSDLMVLALQCDQTRVISFMLGNAGSGRSYPFLNVTGGHHELSHHQKSAEKLSALQTIGTWEIQQVAYLVGKLKAIDEGGTSLLDNTALFFSSEISDGDRHNHDDMPVLLVGRLGGAIRAGRYISSPIAARVPLANLYLSLIAAAGAQADRFGNSTGPFSLL